MKKLLQFRKAPVSRGMGPNVRQVIPSAVDNLDPFVFLDHFAMVKKPNGQWVPPHPHAGIATITYLFSGSNRHQDSYGHDAMIHAGDLAWMQAGKGIVHSEGMNENRTEEEYLHGLQLWISLPAKDKFIEPDFFFYPATALPTTQHEGSEIKVICGELFEQTAPTKSLSPAYIFEVKMPAHANLTLPIAEGNTCGVYVIGGNVLIEGNELAPMTMAAFSREGNAITLQTSAEAHCIVLGGTPLDEPIVGYASYVMNSEAQIRQVMLDYEAGKMGTL